MEKLYLFGLYGFIANIVLKAIHHWEQPYISFINSSLTPACCIIIGVIMMYPLY